MNSALRALPTTISTFTAIAAGSAPAGAFFTVLTPVPSAWVNTTAYVVGDRVTAGALEYECLIAHTSTLATDKPGSGITTGQQELGWQRKWRQIAVPASWRLNGFAKVVLKNKLTGTGSTIDVSYDGGLHSNVTLDAGDMLEVDFPTGVNYGAIAVRGNTDDPTAGSLYAAGWVKP